MQMSFLESLLRRSYEQIEDKKGNWCTTPGAPELRKEKVRTVKRGKSYDFLLGPISTSDSIKDETRSD